MTTRVFILFQGPQPQPAVYNWQGFWLHFAGLGSYLTKRSASRSQCRVCFYKKDGVAASWASVGPSITDADVKIILMDHGAPGRLVSAKSPQAVGKKLRKYLPGCVSTLRIQVDACSGGIAPLNGQSVAEQLYCDLATNLATQCSSLSVSGVMGLLINGISRADNSPAVRGQRLVVAPVKLTEARALQRSCMSPYETTLNALDDKIARIAPGASEEDLKALALEVYRNPDVRAFFDTFAGLLARDACLLQPGEDRKVVYSTAQGGSPFYTQQR